MKKLILASLVGLTSLPVAADSNFSAEFLLGKTDQEARTDYGDVEGDDTSIGIRGGYSINENVTLELSYNNYGEIDKSYIDEYGDYINDKVSTTSMNFGVKGSIPLNNGLSIYARIGLSLWDVEFEETDSFYPGETFKGDDSGNDIYYGLGLQYQINDKAFIGAEYTLSEYGVKLGGDFQGLDADVDIKTFALSIGLNF